MKLPNVRVGLLTAATDPSSRNRKSRDPLRKKADHFQCGLERMIEEGRGGGWWVEQHIITQVWGSYRSGFETDSTCMHGSISPSAAFALAAFSIIHSFCPRTSSKFRIHTCDVHNLKALLISSLWVWSSTLTCSSHLLGPSRS